MTRAAARIAATHPTALDVEILRHIWRHEVIRRSTLAALTGSSGWSVKERVASLAERGWLARATDEAILRTTDGGLVRTTCVTWQAAGRGPARAGTWTVSGTGQTITATDRKPKILSSSTERLARASLAAWYGAYGWGVATPRELRLAGGATPWTITVGDVSRLPLLGVTDPAGQRWSVEVVLEGRTD